MEVLLLASITAYHDNEFAQGRPLHWRLSLTRACLMMADSKGVFTKRKILVSLQWAQLHPSQCWCLSPQNPRLLVWRKTTCRHVRAELRVWMLDHHGDLYMGADQRQLPITKGCWRKARWKQMKLKISGSNRNWRNEFTFTKILEITDLSEMLALALWNWASRTGESDLCCTETLNV